MQQSQVTAMELSRSTGTVTVEIVMVDL